MKGVKVQGVTFIELIIVLVIILSVFLIVIPGVSHLYQNQIARSEMERWRGMMQLARQSAISYQNRVTLCPSSNGISCSGSWHQGGLLFVDKDYDASLSSGDVLLRRVQPAPASYEMYWRSFQGKDYLQFDADGFTNALNGTLSLCSSKAPFYHRAIIVSRSGRVRHARDYNNDGLYESSPGAQINC